MIFLQKTAFYPSFLLKQPTYKYKKEVEACAPITFYRLKSFLIRCTVDIPFPVSVAIVLIL